MEYGARGLIAGGLNQKDIATIAGKELDLANTGLEKMGFTIIMTEGAGFMPMNNAAWQVFKESQRHLTSVDGTTRLIGELKRPWIFISTETRPDEDRLDDTKETDIEQEHSVTAGRSVRAYPKTGDRVRCLRHPYCGLWGVIEEVIPNKVRLESESLMEAVRVRLDDGRVVTVADANIEVMIQ